MKATLVGAQRDDNYYYDTAVVERAAGVVVELDWLDGMVEERPARPGETYDQAVAHFDTLRSVLCEVEFQDEANVRAKLGVSVEDLDFDQMDGLALTSGSEERRRAARAGRSGLRRIRTV